MIETFIKPMMYLTAIWQTFDHFFYIQQFEVCFKMEGFGKNPAYHYILNLSIYIYFQKIFYIYINIFN